MYSNANENKLELPVTPSPFDITVGSGVSLPSSQKRDVTNNDQLAILKAFEQILSAGNVSADPSKNQHYRKGWRSGEGAALAVLFPQTLKMLWDCLKIAVENNLIIIMQAANTGLTEGSTPSGNNYDRPVVVINTLALDGLVLLNEGEQVLSFPGTTLHVLEQSLAEINRAPHSVIGSSCLGASIVGGIANNSGGALVKRGPAYTELSLHARINEQGELELVNHLGIALGEDADEIIMNLQNGAFDKSGLSQGDKVASDKAYIERIKQVDADTPSRFNADPRRLYEASGCAGKLAIFAVRVDTHALPQNESTFYVGTNDPVDLYTLRRRLLTELDDVPEVGEYMHRDIFNVSEKYGKDTFLSVLHLGTKRLPKLFALKGRIDASLNKVSWLPSFLTDRCMQFMSTLFPQHLPSKLLAYRDRYEHHLVIKLSDQSIDVGREIIESVFKEAKDGNFFECNEDEAKKAYLNRFAAAGAALRYQTIHEKRVGDILALDIALRRNEKNWVEALPDEIMQHIEKPLYYGHFFCYVFHQDYILKKGSDAAMVKSMMLKLLDSRGAKYPAEHNVGHLYDAETPLVNFYQSLDPQNVFNPGIGKQDKTRRNCSCSLHP